VKRLFDVDRGRHHGKIDGAVRQGTDGLRCGMIGNLQAHMWIIVVEKLQFVQKKQAQGCLTCPDGHKTAFETFVF